jgi:hypothetical protein
MAKFLVTVLTTSIPKATVVSTTKYNGCHAVDLPE